MSEAATITLPLGGKSQGNHTDLGPNIIELLKQHQKVPTFELLYEEKKNCLSHFLVSFSVTSNWNTILPDESYFSILCHFGSSGIASLFLFSENIIHSLS